MSKLPLGISRAIANAVGRLSRLLGRGGGTTAPGVALLKLRPRAVAELAPTLGGPSVVISATNGKTTTARLLSSCVEADGRSVLANRSGSNLLRGVAAALLDVDGTDQTGVFEVDEAALSEVTAQLEPDVVALMNLFRDQLDRYGELEHLADRWVEIVSALPESTIAVLNADDPAIAELGQHHDNVVYFGLDDPAIARTDLQHAADSVTCRNCAAPLTYDTIHLSHLGHWRCTNCGRRRPTPSVTATEVRLDGLDATHLIIATASGPITTTVSLPGVHNAYNVVAATAAALALDIDPDTIGPALTATEAAFGRAERVELDGRTLTLLLAKNPAGVNENLRTLLLDPEPVHLLIQLNDRTADGRDVSWIWDVDYELAFDHIASLTVSGDRAYDLALRFRYGGIDEDLLTVIPAVAAALDHAVATVPAGGSLYALPTYTSMLELRSELARRGVAAEFWEDR